MGQLFFTPVLALNNVWPWNKLVNYLGGSQFFFFTCEITLAMPATWNCCVVQITYNMLENFGKSDTAI